LFDFLVCAVLQNHQYYKTSAVNFLSPSGAKAIVYGEYVVKITEDIFIIVDEGLFNQLFSIEWKLINQ